MGILAQSSFVEQYFSFIVLGLVMTLGYVVYRLYGPKKTDDWEGAEGALRQAELEVREQAAIRQAREAEEKPAAEPEPIEESDPERDEEKPADKEKPAEKKNDFA